VGVSAPCYLVLVSGAELPFTVPCLNSQFVCHRTWLEKQVRHWPGAASAVDDLL